MNKFPIYYSIEAAILLEKKSRKALRRSKVKTQDILIHIIKGKPKLKIFG